MLHGLENKIEEWITTKIIKITMSKLTINLDLINILMYNYTHNYILVNIGTQTYKNL